MAKRYDPRLDPGPIEADLNPLMKALARGLDDILNKGCAPGQRKVWFFLAAGAMAGPNGEEPVTNRFNYISNADKLDVRATLHDVLARLEARISTEEGRA